MLVKRVNIYVFLKNSLIGGTFCIAGRWLEDILYCTYGVIIPGPQIACFV